MTSCDAVRPLLASHVDDRDPAPAEVADHVRGCEACAKHLAELRWAVDVLKATPRPAPPADFRARLHDLLDAEPAPGPAPAAAVLAQAPVRPRASHWLSFAAGLVAAVALAYGLRSFGPSGPRPTQLASLPLVTTAAVAQDKDVAVQIGFDVASDVKDVTFQIDLPEGLRFVDGSGNPVVGRSVSWKGELRSGKTVVPVTVRGLRPGSWPITASVRKGALVQQTRIVLPVQPRGAAYL